MSDSKGRSSVIINNITKYLDMIAGLIILCIIVLIVINVVLRGLGSSVAGTYEFTSLFTAIVIGFSLAYCAVNDGHIAVTLFVERLPSKISRVITFIFNSIAVVFWFFVSFRILGYAGGVAARKEVSPLLKMPQHIFVYAIAISFFILSIVLVSKLLETRTEEKK